MNYSTVNLKQMYIIELFAVCSDQLCEAEKDEDGHTLNLKGKGLYFLILWKN